MKYSLSEISSIIRERRTIYPEDYSSRKVHKEIITHVLTNGTWAPTHGMVQPWRFIVYQEEKQRVSLSEFLSQLYKQKSAGSAFMERKFEKLRSRPLISSVVIAICMEHDPNGKVSEQDNFAAVACAVQNMYLTCTAYGIGGFWATPGLVHADEMNEFLGLESNQKCVGLFYMGYPKAEWPEGHRKPLEYVTEWK